MTIFDTSVVVSRVKLRKPINEDITVVTLVEYQELSIISTSMEELFSL